MATRTCSLPEADRPQLGWEEGLVGRWGNSGGLAPALLLSLGACYTQELLLTAGRSDEETISLSTRVGGTNWPCLLSDHRARADAITPTVTNISGAHCTSGATPGPCVFVFTLTSCDAGDRSPLCMAAGGASKLREGGFLPKGPTAAQRHSQLQS